MAALVSKIGPANAALGRYDGLLAAIPNKHVLLSPLMTQEAILSSRIEGTVVTMGEVLEIEAAGASSEFTQSKREDAEEVLNYRKTMLGCISELNHRKMSQSLLRTAHQMLLDGVRGRDKSPGQYRSAQNWIGPSGCSIDEAGYVPVRQEQLQNGMDRWEEYLDQTAEVDVLVQLAVLHAEFEALHPFEDGNGRLGRILIPLFLFQRKLLASPDFYMSSYLESNREVYVEKLRGISRDNDWTGWCMFFLEGIRRQSFSNESKARSILLLYNRLKMELVENMRSQYSIRALDFLFQTPVFASTTFVKQSGIPKPTATRLLNLLRELSVLTSIRKGKGRRAGIYAFRELVNLAEGVEVF